MKISLFSPDYWSMDDHALALLAKQYKIPHAWRNPQTGASGMDRESFHG